jgi:SAM-dependent methyltransferase
MPRLLPFASAVFRTVTCSMAVMVLEPVEVALGEISRVLEPSGTAVLLLPGSLPVGVRDTLRYARLLASLHRIRLGYPNRLAQAELRTRLERCGLEVVENSCRRFAYPLGDRGSALRFVESLYTPGVESRHVDAAVRVAYSWVGSDIGIPLRRVICRKRST